MTIQHSLRVCADAPKSRSVEHGICSERETFASSYARYPADSPKRPNPAGFRPAALQMHPICIQFGSFYMRAQHSAPTSLNIRIAMRACEFGCSLRVAVLAIRHDARSHSSRTALCAFQTAPTTTSRGTQGEYRSVHVRRRQSQVRRRPSQVSGDSRKIATHDSPDSPEI
jgi:hypothetical protein